MQAELLVTVFLSSTVSFFACFPLNRKHFLPGTAAKPYIPSDLSFPQWSIWNKNSHILLASYILEL